MPALLFQKRKNSKLLTKSMHCICKGEVSGRLHVEVYRLSDMDDSGVVSSMDSLDSSRAVDPQSIGAAFLGKTIKCRVCPFILNDVKALCVF